MLLEQACDWLGWPQPHMVLDPQGEGAKVCAEIAKSKIGEPLKRAFPELPVETGILTSDPIGAGTAAPLAVICQFPAGAQADAMQEAHRLAWNFSRAALLITLEPHRLMAWSCLQDPGQSEDLRRLCELPTPDGSRSRGTAEQRQIRELLHWVSLITGAFLRQRAQHFPPDGRADVLLLKNLRHVRGQLIDSGLNRNICHDLLARIIFTQFLFHRKDSTGNPFFNKNLLERRCDGYLTEVHDDLPSILQKREETYSLFSWLDDRFNGDLFPGGEDHDDFERKAAWQAEKDAVKPHHLRLLADLVSGGIDTTDRQLQLWPMYAFDTIPLEFISSVYEEFLTEDRDSSKAYYTPPYLVDYVLDAVLPWEGREWDLHILDPACGSGIFLVKAFQRLIHRWRRRHDREPLVRDLKPLLANNFYGIDRNPDAVRVACFSLYLAMADAIDPKHYATRERVFPPLRGSRLIARDFFDETTEGIRTREDKGSFDLVIGNAPWGESSALDTSDALASESAPPRKENSRRKRQTKAERWARIYRWRISNHDIGPLFVAKSLHLVREAGRVAMLQPAPAWLYNRQKPAKSIRKKLFSSFIVDEVTNLSALRRELFSDVIGPSCVLVVGHGTPEPSREFYYFTPKPSGNSVPVAEIEPQDVFRVTHDEAANDPFAWSVLALGGRRDLHLIRQLQGHNNLAKLKKSNKVLTRLGVIPGKKNQRILSEHSDKPFFGDPQFPDDVFIELDASLVDNWSAPKVTIRDSTNFEAFKNPQLLIKHSFVSQLGRFRAALVRTSDPTWGVICKKTYLTVRDLSEDARHIHAAALAYNSRLAAYYLSLTSSRIGHYITETTSGELVTVPLPKETPDISSATTFEEIDLLARQAYSLTEADWTLIEDLLDVRLPDALRKAGPGRRPTARGAAQEDSEPEMSAYGETLIRVIKSTFGDKKPIAVTIYRELEASLLPVRMMTVHLNWIGRPRITLEAMEADDLFDRLASLHREVLEKRALPTDTNGLSFRRVAFFFHSHQTKRERVQNLTIIKPDEYRYWTRSQAMRDADELASAIIDAAARDKTRP